MKRTVVLNVVGLTESLIGRSTPHIKNFVSQGSKATILPSFPAVTCTAQATYLTGVDPAEHGIVGNGWYHRELAEVHFWKQSNHLVGARKLWQELRQLDPKFTCAKLFWWYNMYASVDYSITPRPIYCADGRKIFDIYSHPFSIRSEIKKELGEFPFVHFWGPAADIKSSRWIAQAAQWIEEKFQPTLSLVYLPHLDYPLQRVGPHHSSIHRELQELDQIVGELISFFEKRSVQWIILSEYGISEVDTPIHINRIFRNKGWIAIKDEIGREILDCGASKVFAVADHQIAHIYLNDISLEKEVLKVLEQEPGIDRILTQNEKKKAGIDHSRAGDIIAVAQSRSWFTYYYWLDDSLAPDFACSVDIHRKPGYDPVELFLDPKIRFPELKMGLRLFQKKLGFRALMDVIPLDAHLIKGSHGRLSPTPGHQPMLIQNSKTILPPQIQAKDVYGTIKRAILEN